mgnify:CR=1 FL=1
MAMTREEKIAIADMVRSRDRFGPVTPEELAVLPGKERELWIQTKDGKSVHVFEERLEYLPEPAPLFLNFHGGGFLKGRTDRDRRYCCAVMERLKCLVWDIDYCLAPENPFPYAVEEAYEIACYAFEHASEIGIDPEKIILAGHSAGGNLVASVLIKNAETKELHPCCVLMEYFPTDNTVNPVERLSEKLKRDPFWVKRAETEKMYTDFYVENADPANPLCSPAFAENQALAAFPDCLILSAGEDSLREDTEAFGMRLIKAGVCVTMQRIPEARHGFTTNRTPGWERALERQYQFFQEHLK